MTTAPDEIGAFDQGEDIIFDMFDSLWQASAPELSTPFKVGALAPVTAEWFELREGGLLFQASQDRGPR